MPQSLAYKDAGGQSRGTDATESMIRDQVENGTEGTNHTNDKDAHGPIAVFRQTSADGRNPPFRFEGWFKIRSLSFLEPESEELVRMLEQKWSRTDETGKTLVEGRRGTLWGKSL